MIDLPPDDPRVEVSDKTYVAFKALDMGFDAHMTVIYLGKISVLQERLAQTIIDEFPYLYQVGRNNIEMFGPNNDIPVVTVIPPVGIWKLRKKLEQYSYLPNPSEYAWNPHITLDAKPNQVIIIPPAIRLTMLGLY